MYKVLKDMSHMFLSKMSFSIWFNYHNKFCLQITEPEPFGIFIIIYATVWITVLGVIVCCWDRLIMCFIDERQLNGHESPKGKEM